MPTDNNKKIRLSLSSCGGRCNKKYIDTVPGDTLPSLPTPARKGYDFDGWYTKISGGDKIDADTCFDADTEIYAHWSKNDSGRIIEEKRKSINMRKRQRMAIIIMAVAVVLLAAALIAVNIAASIYKYEDVDGNIYYIRKKNGVYALYDDDGLRCDVTQDGYYQTKLGTQLMIDASNGSISDTIYVDDLNSLHKDEIYGYSGRVLMFKQMTYDASSTLDKSIIISSIAVTNSNGSFTFKRGENNTFYVEGKEGLLFNTELFAQFAVACGKPLSMDVLRSPNLTDSGEIDLSEYGLASEIRERTEKDEDGNEVTVEYEYSPAVYTITSMTGEWHRVIVGDAIVSGAGYYAMYDGGYVKNADGSFSEVGKRDRIYIIGTAGVEDGILARIEDLITPMIVYPLGASTYFDVKNFVIYDKIDYKAIDDELKALYGERFDGMTQEEISAEIEKDPDIAKKYAEIFEKHSGKICDFSYIDLNERYNSMKSYFPYESHIEYSKGYYVNSDNINAMLYKLSSMEFVEVVKLSPKYEELAKYGLTEASYVVEFLYHESENDTEEGKSYVYNTVSISKKDENGHYYAYSENFDMIVCIDESYLEFLDWDEDKWYDDRYLILDISSIQDIIIESPSFSAEFKFDNSQSSIAKVYPSSKLGEELKDADGNKYTVGRDGDIYVLMSGSEKLKAVKRGDYMTGGISYSVGVREDANYIFSEYKTQDVNSDDVIDYVLYYFYDVQSVEGKYQLTAQAIQTDTSGNRLGEAQNIVGKPTLECTYFTTDSGFLFFADKESALGRALDARYSTYKIGSWHEGNVYVTADKENIVIDSKTGEWARISDLANPVYFGDDESSMLIKGAVRTETVYDASGNIKTPGELYYATGGSDLRFNTETGKVEKYTKRTKTWSNATSEDCCVGVWASGAYYLTDGGDVYLVNEATGDVSDMTIGSATSAGGKVFFNGDKLDYEIDTVLSTGKLNVKNEVDNFREFYKGLLYGTLEGMADLSEEQMKAFRESDDFSLADKNNPCQLKVTVLAEDSYGNTRYTVYRFYRYSERKSYFTIEMLDSPDTSSSNSENGYGKFYVLSSYAEKIISDAQKLIEGKEVAAASKY